MADDEKAISDLLEEMLQILVREVWVGTRQFTLLLVAPPIWVGFGRIQ